MLDPGHPDAGHCLRSYAAELRGLLDGGFDPANSRLHGAGGYTEVPACNDEPYAHHWFEKRI
ncbi:hypothetical protein GCM10010234_60900 [Streptomyces hawaiiensis]